jgi:catechol 2,3-dioxygenase-like lactoylglutathione lyase family enzyme
MHDRGRRISVSEIVIGEHDMPELNGIHHIALTVSDAEASATFYSQLLGLDVAFRIDDDTLCARILAGDGFLFAVRHYKRHDKDRFSEFRTGIDHMAFGVRDRDTLAAFEKRLEELGTTYTPTAETPFGPVVVFRDPDGIQIEFFVTETGA